jgi:DNA-binding CsgD family transcriptional regulator
MTVGRQIERAALGSFLDDLPAGPSALLLEGEPGMGKTTLWTEGLELARARRQLVLSCRPSGSDAELAFVGLADLFGELPPASVEGLPAPQRDALEIALGRRPRGDRRLDARAASMAALGVLQSVARDDVVLVAVDDVHQLDASSARVLTFAIRRLSSEPVGLLLARSAVEEAPPLGAGDALPPERLHRVAVPPLGAEEMSALVRERVGLALSTTESKRLERVSGGNPFFALEIARAAARGDQGVTGQSLPIPRSLRDDVVRQHLVALPDSCRDLLLLAAALGRPSLDLLAAGAGAGASAETLQPAIDAGVITVGAREVRFTHPLYRSAVYAEASRARRHDVHRRLADLTVDPEERARHLALSADGSDEGVAHALEEAARLARDRGAPDASADLLEHAIRLTPDGSDAALRRRHLAASEDRFAAGDTAASAEHAKRALDLTNVGPDRAEALRRIAAIELARGAIADARDLLDEAATEAGDDTLVSAEVHRDLAGLLLRSGELEAAERHASSAISPAERAGEAPLLAAARGTIARVGILRGDAAAVLRSPDLAPARPDDEMTLVLAEAEIVLARHEAARERLSRALASARERGDEPARRGALVRLAELELRDGDWSAATRHAEEARRLARQLDLRHSMELGVLAALEALRGREEPARALARDGLRDAGEDRLAQRWCLCAIGLLELGLGHPDVAVRHLGRASGIASDIGIVEPAETPFLSDEAEALAGAGAYGPAAARIDWLEERGTALDRPSALAAAARARGLLQAQTGDVVAALSSLERSVELLDALPLPFETARSLLALGGCRRRDRQKRPAREALENALRSFEDLGADPWAERARAELGRVSGRRASISELTESENRVVRLAAAGRTNREIAQSLSMSVRTVEGHLSHAYAKLGLRSRTELALFVDRSE